MSERLVNRGQIRYDAFSMVNKCRDLWSLSGGYGEQVAISNSGGQSVPIRDKLRLYSGYSVNTGAGSEKLLKEAAGQLSIRKSRKRLKILLDSGSRFFNVQKLLEPDEALHIRTSAMGAGIRGTCGWVKIIGQ